MYARHGMALLLHHDDHKGSFHVWSMHMKYTDSIEL
jgi:hypothetical protein